MVLEVQDLRYHVPGNGKALVDGISFSVAAGETLVLLGRSGAGKTTTLKLVNRLLTPTAARCGSRGRPAAEVGETQLRRGIGYVIQEVDFFPTSRSRRMWGCCRGSSAGLRNASSSACASCSRW